MSGQVIGVSDGDTITVLDSQRQSIRVRLAGIDAPEKKQPFGAVSKRKLSDQAFGRRVTVEWFKTDPYGRVVGKVLVDGTDINLEQIRSGLAWHYKRYANEQTPRDRLLYAQAEQQARQNRIGLWSVPDQVAPWAFRQLERVRAQWRVSLCCSIPGATVWSQTMESP